MTKVKLFKEKKIENLEVMMSLYVLEFSPECNGIYFFILLICFFFFQDGVSNWKKVDAFWIWTRVKKLNSRLTD